MLLRCSQIVTTVFVYFENIAVWLQGAQKVVCLKRIENLRTKAFLVGEAAVFIYYLTVAGGN